MINNFLPGSLFVPQRVDTPGLTRFERLLTRFFACSLWTGGVGCPCLRRWALWNSKSQRVFLHRFIADEWSLDMHDHSAEMISIGIWGSYDEHTPEGVTRWRAPWVRRFPATWVHRITLVTPNAWTLVWSGKKERPSGFWLRGKWTDVFSYSFVAHLRKSCKGDK